MVINAVEAHHGDVEPQSLIAGIVQAADAISAARPGARRETLETYTNRLKQLEDITNSFKGVDKSFAIQAGREVRIMVLPDHVNDADMVLLARDISKQIEAELEYPGPVSYTHLDVYKRQVCTECFGSSGTAVFSEGSSVCQPGEGTADAVFTVGGKENG